ncbi:MAG: hypothetical protein LBK47_09575 [Prevotellaceae bacterium]|jgi:hypothetical protein|nr:hypothetical protein [Prevotellaceae bacterium]
MKIIQTYWTKPIMTDNSFLENRSGGGWYSFRYNCVSWMYSCLMLRQFYNDVELYTDKIGYELLIEKLCLPYTKVHLCLDDLNDIPVQMWAISKLYTYSLQTEPFLHIDGDVYIWNKFSSEIENAELVVQNMEMGKSEQYYSNALQIMKNNNFQIHSSLSGPMNGNEPIISVNAGVLGGHDIDFINYYSCEALRFFYDNKPLFFSDAAAQLNIILEQLLFYQLAKKNNKHVSILFENISEDFSELMDFDSVPNSKSYIHLIGHAKKNYRVCGVLEKQLQYDFPTEYKTLDNYFLEETVNDNTELWSSFQYSKQLISVFSEENNNLLSTIRNIKYCVKDISENLYNIVKSIYQFERAQHKLWNKNEQNDFDKSDFYRFILARIFLNDQTLDRLLHTKYKIAEYLSIFAADIDVLSIIKKSEWMDRVTSSSKYFQDYSHTTVYLLKKQKNTITTETLKELDQFLYYFSGEAISGEDFANILYEELSPEINLNECRELAKRLLKNHLLYTRYLVVVHNTEDN